MYTFKLINSVYGFKLMHAFDHCTTHMDWNNCEHFACAEIRAANLSGECKFMREFQRGFFGISKHHQVFLH
jgi:mitochondrial inner membrane protease ATP23